MRVRINKINGSEMCSIYNMRVIGYDRFIFDGKCINGMNEMFVVYLCVEMEVASLLWMPSFEINWCDV